MQQALRHPARIGAVVMIPSGGVSIADPERILYLFAASGNLSKDILVALPLDEIENEVENALEHVKDSTVVVGGSDAAIRILGGNSVGALGTRIFCYTGVPWAWPTSDRDAPTLQSALILEADRSLRSENGATLLAQSFADLFAHSGWEVDGFRRALSARFLSQPDWEERAPLAHVGWRALTVDGQFATKMAALLDRPDTVIAAKDRRELHDLLDARAGGSRLRHTPRQSTNQTPRRRRNASENGWSGSVCVDTLYVRLFARIPSSGIPDTKIRSTIVLVRCWGVRLAHVRIHDGNSFDRLHPAGRTPRVSP